ncbi:MAG: peptidylprolyl isomerase [Candidatus Cardinium sp.]|nr:peptidylprolyl isomerase [Candidatus Cardinium sp.]
MFSKKKLRCLVVYFFASVLLCMQGHASTLLLDKVIATVDEEQILYSDLEGLCAQLALEGKATDPAARRNLLHELILSKLFLAKARIEATKVEEAVIQRQCDAYLAVWIKQAGSEEKLVAHFHRPIKQIRAMLKGDLEERALMAEVKRKLIEPVVVTPSEVKDYFEGLPLDKRSYYPTAFELLQLVIYPKVAPANLEAAKQKLLAIKKKLVADPTAFATLAKAHSEDPISASNGGALGWVAMGTLDPAYEAAAISLKVGAISDPVWSSFGWHLIELLGRNTNQYNTRHILHMVQPTQEEIDLAEVVLNQIREKIVQGTLTMEAAIQQYAEDKNNLHVPSLTDPSKEQERISAALLPVDSLDPAVYFAVEGLQVGEVTKPQFIHNHRKPAWRLLYVKQKVEAHAMNLAQDYAIIHDRLLQEKQQQALQKWVQDAQSTFIINIDPAYQLSDGL